MKKLLVYTVLILASLGQGSSAEDGNGGQPGAFMDLTLGGRPAAMGGAYAAIADGGIGHLYNPAGPAQSSKSTFSFSYRSMKLDRSLGFASFTIPARENAALSLFWIHAGTSDLEARDVQGNILSDLDVSYNENMLGINFAKAFIPEIILGGKVYYLQNNISDINASTVGADLGLLVKLDMRKTFLERTFPLLQAGLTVERIGAIYKWVTTSFWQEYGRERGSAVDEKFPINYVGGLAMIKPGKYLLAFDVEASAASIVKTHIGGEYSLNRNYFLRGGLDDMHPTIGFGVLKRMDKFALRVDLSYLTDRFDEGDDFLVSFDLIF